MYFLYNIFQVLVLVTVLCSATSDNCDKNGVLLYEAMGCTPVKNETDHCPSSFNCDFSQIKSSCLFKGRTYETLLTDSECQQYCRCMESNSVECVSLECPDFLGIQRNDPNCYLEYTLGQCCPIGKICSKTCEVDGNTYKIGEKFYPQNTCLTCVCHEEFTGEFDEKTCMKQSCVTQIEYHTQIGEKCAPVYSKSDSGEALCCPDYFVCPDGTEDLDKLANTECSYGAKKLKLGQYFEKILYTYEKVINLKCECILPPLVTCKEV